jgi:uncharacterized membrane protein YhaH (DUF805 family)
MFERMKFVLFSFNGRISRTQFWLGLLGWLVIQWIGGLFAHGLDLFLGTPTLYHADGSDVGPIMLAATVAFVVLVCALPVKRMHDRNKPATYIVGLLLPIYNLVLLFELGFLRGTVGDNEWGPDPTDPSSAPLPHRSAAVSTGPDLVDRLGKLQQLRNSGGVTDEEFATLKAGLLRDAQPASLSRNEPRIDLPIRSSVVELDKADSHWGSATAGSSRSLLPGIALHGLLAVLCVVAAIVGTIALIRSTSQGANPNPDAARQEEAAAASISDMINSDSGTNQPTQPVAAPAEENGRSADPGTNDSTPTPSPSVADESPAGDLLAIYFDYMAAKFCADQGYRFNDDDVAHLQSLAAKYEAELQPADAQTTWTQAKGLAQLLLGPLSAVSSVEQSMKCQDLFQQMFPLLGRQATDLPETAPF